MDLPEARAPVFHESQPRLRGDKSSVRGGIQDIGPRPWWRHFPSAQILREKDPGSRKIDSHERGAWHVLPTTPRPERLTSWIIASDKDQRTFETSGAQSFQAL